MGLIDPVSITFLVQRVWWRCRPSLRSSNWTRQALSIRMVPAEWLTAKTNFLPYVLYFLVTPSSCSVLSIWLFGDETAAFAALRHYTVPWYR